jgi:hypothetical protein
LVRAERMEIHLEASGSVQEGITDAKLDVVRMCGSMRTENMKRARGLE